MTAHTPERWNPRWNYDLGGEPRSVCACPDGMYEGARPATCPRWCERCGGLMPTAAHTPDGGGLTEAEREALVARALFDHDWLGSTDKNREAVWVMHRDAYLGTARAVLPVIARIVAAEHDGCADLLDAASEAILAARSAPDTEAVAAALDKIADEWQWGAWSDVLIPDATKNPIANGQRVTDWLRDRAAGVREGRA